MNLRNLQFIEVNVPHCWLMDHMDLSLVPFSSLFPLVMMYLEKLLIYKFRLKSAFWNFHKLYTTRVDTNYDFLLAEIGRCNARIY